MNYFSRHLSIVSLESLRSVIDVGTGILTCGAERQE